VITLGLSVPLAATANNKGLVATPSVFVGTAAQCGGTAGNNIVTSAWLSGMGLPDSGSSNLPNPKLNPSNDPADKQQGLLLSKNGPTSNCSAAQATIENLPVNSPITTLGFDYRIGGHCGLGAPRYDVTAVGGAVYFVGCASGTHTSAPQDAQWERVVFSNANFSKANPSSPDFIMGTTPVIDITIILDEGTDTASPPNDPGGVGLAVLDNLYINHSFIKGGSGISPTP